jgi:putative NADH-flavin reductase
LTITVIGATGRVGSAVVQRLVTANAAVRVLVRDPGKAQRLFGDSPFLEIIRIRLDNPAAVAAGLTGSDAVFLAMGSVGLQASLQRIVIQAAAATQGLRQLVRLSVLNAGPDSLGINPARALEPRLRSPGRQRPVHHDPARYLLRFGTRRGTRDQVVPDLDRAGQHRSGSAQRPPGHCRRRRPRADRTVHVGTAP